MKNVLFELIIGLMVIGNIYAEMFDVKVGDDVKSVYKVMGEPESYIMVGNKAVVSYERGKIELISNKVSKVSLVSTEQVAMLREQESEQRAKAIEAKAKKHDYMAKEGNALKQKKLEDVEFLSSPIAEQFEYWKKFRRRYPMVDMTPIDLVEMATTITENARQRAEAAEKAKNDELLKARWKLMEAQERAHQAELEASRSRRSRYIYGSYLYPPQIILPGYPNRPCPTPYGTIKPVSPFRPGGGKSVVGGGGSRIITPAPHAGNWPSHTPGVFPNTIR